MSSSGNKFFFKKNLSPFLALVLMIVSGFVVYFFFPKPVKVVMANPQIEVVPQKMKMLRLKDYKFTHPLMFADLPTEDTELNGLKEKISEIISRDKALNMLTDISVYFRKLDDGSWFVINGSKAYSPASLMKVAFLISILKQSANDRGLLNKKVYFEKHIEVGYNQNIKSFSLAGNKYYTIKELLYDMIAYSDNDALFMIGRNINQTVFQKLFSDLGVTTPPTDPAKGADYVVTVSDYCKLFRILYNSGYLTDENSELALSMLSKSTYRGGLLKDISPNLPVAHKFGERVTANSQQLHEIGIFYTEPQPYLLGVMSEGADLKNLSEVLSQISQVVYGDYSKGN